MTRDEEVDRAQEITLLTKQRDEARAEIQRRCQDLGNAEAEIERLRAALQKITDTSEATLLHASRLWLEQCVAIARAALAQAADGGKANL